MKPFAFDPCGQKSGFVPILPPEVSPGVICFNWQSEERKQEFFFPEYPFKFLDNWNKVIESKGTM